jgi:hypothetical protein
MGKTSDGYAIIPCAFKDFVLKRLLNTASHLSKARMSILVKLRKLMGKAIVGIIFIVTICLV